MFVVLVADWAFVSVCGKKIFLIAGTRVYVDLERMIAVTDGVHFDVECTDFVHHH
jgi:hypothetical protein